VLGLRDSPKGWRITANIAGLTFTSSRIVTTREVAEAMRAKMFGISDAVYRARREWRDA
jgi:hypothetical protein